MKNKRKVTTAVVATVTALALMLGGTFAWQSINQTALNEASDVITPADVFTTISTEATKTFMSKTSRTSPSSPAFSSASTSLSSPTMAKRVLKRETRSSAR